VRFPPVTRRRAFFEIAAFRPRAERLRPDVCRRAAMLAGGSVYSIRFYPRAKN